MKVKKMVDLSWEISDTTPIYPGDPEPHIETTHTIEKDYYNLSGVYVGTQTGSHVDSPYHFRNDGDTIDKMEPDFFFGPAVVVRVTDKQAEEKITMEDMKPYMDKIGPGTIVLFNTNWYKNRGTDLFYTHPFVAGEVAEWLVEQGVKFIAIDTMNADQSNGTEFPVHDLFADKRLMIGENWAYLDQIDFDNVWIAAFPWKIQGCDGSPVRAIAMEIEE